ncbi:MAG: translation initiation factor [Patescibacteria group bacterium]|nr:translation initiation factor [Patescibacteria group bacterium]
MPKAKKAVVATPNTYRPPVVTIMGHVDHGKTSILDAIRNSNVVKGESGGITQHIGAYTIETNGKKITFIDTPGHEAFTQMRSRGGAAADIVILVVAANDGVKPQTKEAIMHAKAANVPIIVAINKIDLPTADPMRVKKQLGENGIMVEGFGGDIVAVDVSATQKTNLDQLLEVINLTAEMEQEKYKSDPSDRLEAIIIESKRDNRRGVLVSVVVKKGVLKLGDEIIVSGITGKVKSMSSWNQKSIKEILTGEAGELMGISDVPHVGDIIYRKGDSPEQAEISAESSEKVQQVDTAKDRKLNLIIRADTVGTQEAIEQSLAKVIVDDARPEIILAGTGDVKESDVLLASTARAIIIAFKVSAPGSIAKIAESNKVIIREHEIIYKLIEEIEGALEGVLEIEEAKIKGKGIVIDKFVLPKSGMVVAGTLVEAGRFKVNNRVGIFREDMDTPLYVARIRSIHIGKGEKETAGKGDECGLLFKPELPDIQLDDTVKIL